MAQKNYPIEFAEMEFGVRVEGYGLHHDSGGPGRWRGGCGIVRDLRVIARRGGDRRAHGQHPLSGVRRGRRHGRRRGRFLVNPGTPGERELKPMSDGNILKKGDVVRIMTPGGGGWGSPLERRGRAGS